MKHIILTFIVLSFVGKTFSQDSFKELFEQSFIHLSNESYQKALPILLDMEKMDPKNSNTLFSIGNCYMHTIYNKDLSIPYFERIMDDYKNMTLTYKVGNHKEKQAPIETFRLLGQAYHFDYQFEKALEKYEEYKDVLDPQNYADNKAIDRDIQITKNAMELKANPIDMRIKGITKINTEYAEYRPKVTGDENKMYFTSRRKNSEHTAVDEEGKYYEDVYYSLRKFGEWQEPVLLNETINTPSHDACLYTSPDGQYMLIFRASAATLTEGGIYETTLNGDTWSEPSLVQADINSNYWETDVSVSADGSSMFFTSDRPGGIGGRDIWMMKKLPDGEWANVQNIGNVINSEYDEEGPYLHPDGKTLYFSSKGHNTMGGFDVFKSEKQEDGSWGTPENIGYPINTTGDDVFYFPTNDGLRAYFSSFRKGGKGDQDIYILELPNFEPKTLAVYKGIAKYSDGEVIKDMVITIFDDSTGEEVGIYRPNATTGRFLFILQPGQRYEVEYDADNLQASDLVNVPNSGGIMDIVKLVVREGNTLKIATGEVDDSDIISLVEEEDPTNVEITDVIVSIENPNKKPDDKDPVEENTTTTNVTEYASQGEYLKDLYFLYDRVILIDESEPDYEATLKFLQDNPTVKVKIEGHTDSHGSDEYNQWLSSARSNKIRNRLYDNGVAWGRMSTRGYGEAKPIAPNKNADGSDNPEGRQLNRRVSFVLDEKSVALNETPETIQEEKPENNYVNDNYEIATVDFSQEVVCMVQLGAFKQKLDNKKFTDAPLDVAFYKDEDGLYKYLSGTFINKEVAKEHRLAMIEEGYQDAFLVYFQEGKRLTQEEVALLYPTADGITLENNQANNE
jgi:outer membrane protein OmpA-like peptidoglycan-associated protein